MGVLSDTNLCPAAEDDSVEDKYHFCLSFFYRHMACVSKKKEEERSDTCLRPEVAVFCSDKCQCDTDLGPIQLFVTVTQECSQAQHLTQRHYYLWWSLCTLYLHACQVRVIVGDSSLFVFVLIYLVVINEGDSGLCCCT